MPVITINQKKIEVPEGTTILQAAKLLNINIPTMCWKEGFKHSTSCMVCLVEDKRSKRLLTACSSLVIDGQDIETDNEEIRAMRRGSLELLLSDHLGDCEAPCQRTCPAGMNIPLMNRLIANGDFDLAKKAVMETIPLPGVLGYICPAPCEKTCRRKDIDQAVSICLLKRFVGENGKFTPKSKYPARKEKVAIIGSGPAGLTTAFYLTTNGFQCTVFDKAELPGGQLRYAIPPEKMPIQALENEIEELRNLGVNFAMKAEINEAFLKDLAKEFELIVLATGFDAGFSEIALNYPEIASVGKIHVFDLNGAKLLKRVSNASPAKMAVQSVGLGRLFAVVVKQLLDNEPITGFPDAFNSTFNRLAEPEFSEYLKESENPGKRVLANNHLSGFSKEMAIEEAKRCLHCDCRKADNCRLRDLSTSYGANQNKFKLRQRNVVTKNFHPQNVVYEPQKCIKCGICIETAKQFGEKAGFTFIGRGFDVHVGFPIGQDFESAIQSAAIACASNCPTGALSQTK